MQKRGKGDCPLCRAPSVMVADRCKWCFAYRSFVKQSTDFLSSFSPSFLANVDWALMNFMQDWFPLEAKEKLKANEKESLYEQLREAGINPDDSRCIIM
jgi:hypothetical protein